MQTLINLPESSRVLMFDRNIASPFLSSNQCGVTGVWLLGGPLTESDGRDLELSVSAAYRLVPWITHAEPVKTGVWAWGPAPPRNVGSPPRPAGITPNATERNGPFLRNSANCWETFKSQQHCCYSNLMSYS